MADESKELPANQDLSPGQRLYFFLNDYLVYILLVIALALLAYKVFDWYKVKHERAEQEAAATLDLTSRWDTETPAGYNDVIERYDVRSVRAFAFAKLGHFYVRVLNTGDTIDGVNKVKVSREDAITKAKLAYNEVLTKYADQPLASAMAHFGLAALAENEQNWDAAAKEYKILTDPAGPFAKTGYGPLAQQRLAELDSFKQPVLMAAGAPKKPASNDLLEMLKNAPAGPTTSHSLDLNAPAGQ